jgi:hypothetical protein
MIARHPVLDDEARLNPSISEVCTASSPGWNLMSLDGICLPYHVKQCEVEALLDSNQQHRLVPNARQDLLRAAHEGLHDDVNVTVLRQRPRNRLTGG